MADVLWAGRVVERATGRLLGGMRVDLFERRSAAAAESTTTDRRGLFRFQLPVARIQELFGDRPLDVYFQVSDEGQRVPGAEGSFAWMPGSGNRYLTIEVDRATNLRATPPLAIGSLDELISEQEEILERISSRANGGHLFLLEPFELLAELGVRLSPEARAEILRAYPGLSALSRTAFDMLSRTRRRQRVRFHIRSLARRRSP
jgi:hypothetical protein